MQFDFPDENGKPYKSSGGKMVWNEHLRREIPKGWNVIPLKESIDHINTGLNPRTNFVFGGDIRYVTVKNLTSEGFLDFSDCDVIDADARTKVHKRSRIAIGDVLYASICPLGRTYLIQSEPDDWDINESVFSIRPNRQVISPEYLNMLLKDNYYIEKLTQSSTGSIFQGIRIKELEQTRILLPVFGVIDSFSSKIKALLKMQAQNNDVINNLIKQRDELLPLLMNGQVNSDLFAV